jgi:DHA1 family tetracycline resistance protein-like MFS transporter
MLLSLIIIWKVLTREKKVQPEIAKAIAGAGKLSDAPTH